jgi:hypothetical protein
MEWLSMNSMNSAWDFTLVQTSDAGDMSKFFSFDDFNQDQDMSEDLDRMFAEPGNAIELETPRRLDHSFLTILHQMPTPVRRARWQAICLLNRIEIAASKM